MDASLREVLREVQRELKASALDNAGLQRQLEAAQVRVYACVQVWPCERSIHIAWARFACFRTCCIPSLLPVSRLP